LRQTFDGGLQQEEEDSSSIARLLRDRIADRLVKGHGLFRIGIREKPVFHAEKEIDSKVVVQKTAGRRVNPIHHQLLKRLMK
jgi:hypothetical protein